MTEMIQLHVGGKQLCRFTHGGFDYVVAPESGDFEVEVRIRTATWPAYCFNSSARKEVCVSVDGLSVMDGKPASVATRGYVTSESSLLVPGWRLDADRVARFELGGKASSYAELSGRDAGNCGIVSAVVFNESAAQVQLRQAPKWGRGDINATLSTAPTHGGDLGAGFGSAADFRTTNTSFERGAEVGRDVVHYRSRAWFAERGIRVPGKSAGEGNPWPGDATGCVPPAGWRG